MLAAAAESGYVQVWSAATGETLHQFQAHEGPCFVAKVSPFGTYLATAGNDHTLRIWNLESGAEVAKFYSR